MARAKTKRCGGCGGRMKSRWAMCPACGRTSATKAGKAAHPRVCHRCQKISFKAAARYCGGCGTVLTGPALKTAAELSAEQQRVTYLAKAAGQHDPAQREALWRRAHPELFGRSW